MAKKAYQPWRYDNITAADFAKLVRGVIRAYAANEVPAENALEEIDTLLADFFKAPRDIF
jgi:hypothetical protein